MKSPNVLFIISDQHQRAVTGCYGNPQVKTPNIDAFADKSVIFDTAYCQSPLCGTSRASVMTGTYPHTCNAYGHGKAFVMHDMPTMGSVFRDAGYFTGSFGKVHIRGEEKNGRDLGFDDRYLRYLTYWWQDYIDEVGKENVDKYWCPDHKGHLMLNPTNQAIDMDEPLMFDALVAKRAVEFIETPREQPFLLWVGLEKPHPEWYAPEEFHAMYDPETMKVPETFSDPFGEELPRVIRHTNFNAKHYPIDHVQHMTAAYYANVTYMDQVFGRIMNALERSGKADNTIVVYTTDHGEMLFDHGLVQKQCFYDASVSIPLIMHAPGVSQAGSRSSAIAGLIDMLPTFCDLTGVNAPEGLEGRSLRNFLEGAEETDAEPAIYSEFYSKGTPERMIRTPEWKYIYTHDDLAQLYHVQKDPLERNNLAKAPEYHDIVDKLQARVMEGWEFDPEIHKEGQYNK